MAFFAVFKGFNLVIFYKTHTAIHKKDEKAEKSVLRLLMLFTVYLLLF